MCLSSSPHFDKPDHEDAATGWGSGAQGLEKKLQLAKTSVNDILLAGESMIYAFHIKDRDDSDSGRLTDCNKTLVEFVVRALYYELSARGEAKAFKRLVTQLIEPLEVPNGLSNPHIF